MRVAYLDCFAGIAGDMFLGALLGAGVPVEVLERATAALNIDASLRIETVDRSGISATKVHVLESGNLAEEAVPLSHSHIDPQAHTHAAEQHTHRHEPLTPQLKTQHQHKTGHDHEHEHGHKHDHEHDHEHPHEHGHDHPHVHGRSLSQIRTLINAAALAEPVKALALRAFELLGQSEAKIHNVPVDDIHFHEVGAVDAIVDIVASAAGVVHLDIGAWHSSPVNVGGGMIECAHGTFPIPAPATADLLRGAPTYSAHIQKELVTPTGAALLRALDPTFGPQPAMTVERIGYGAGTRNPPGFPNVLRLSIGETEVPPPTRSPRNEPTDPANATRSTETVTVLETALDDATPQLLAFVAEQALAQGALDVMLTPVLMKKGRPGTLLTLLSEPHNADALSQLLLRETPTLGLRLRQDQRLRLDRHHTTVDTAFGSIRIKLGSDAGEPRNANPEYEDCKAAALAHGAPLKHVQQAALAAFLTQNVKR